MNALQELVQALLTFMSDHDPYEYMDADVPMEEEALLRAIAAGDVSGIRRRLFLYVIESDDAEVIEEALTLIRRLDLYAMRKGGLCHV